VKIPSDRVIKDDVGSGLPFGDVNVTVFPPIPEPPSVVSVTITVVPQGKEEGMIGFSVRDVPISAGLYYLSYFSIIGISILTLATGLWSAY
jgi:hypothetical protein